MPGGVCRGSALLTLVLGECCCRGVGRWGESLSLTDAGLLVVRSSPAGVVEVSFGDFVFAMSVRNFKKQK